MGSDSVLQSSATQERLQSVLFWTAAAIAAIVTFLFFSDGDFSFLLTLASLMSLCGFCGMFHMVWRAESCAGVSVRMIECYVLVYACRLCAIVPFEGYLPLDKSGDWLYQVLEAGIFIVVCAMLFMCRIKFATSLSEDRVSLRAIAGPCALLALVFHSDLNEHKIADLCWTFAFYLEAVAVFPQLVLFQREKKVQPFIPHFLAGMVVSKIFNFTFWAYGAVELNDPNHSFKAYVSHWILGAGAAQLLLMADFIFHYVRCLHAGRPVSQMLVDVV